MTVVVREEVDMPPVLMARRVHDVYGASREAFALAQLSRSISKPRPVAWIVNGRECLNPEQLVEFYDPALFYHFVCTAHDERLWVMEETLRSGGFAFVVGQFERPVRLTPGRRLQLAAEEGKATGLCLLEPGQAIATAQTRWRCEPMVSSGAPLWRWSLEKDKKGASGTWEVSWRGRAGGLTLA